MKKFILSLSMAALFAAPVFTFADMATDQLIAKLRAQIAELQAQIAALQSGSGFHDGDRVQVDTNYLKIRGGTGRKASVLGKAPRWASGVIHCDRVPQTQCPVMIGDLIWWYIVWDSSTLPSGWSAEGSSEAQFLFKRELTATSSSSIQILSPNGGEQWQKGTTQTIKWSAPSSVSAVSISLEPWYECLHTPPYCGLAVRPYTIAASTPNDGVFEWAVGKDASGNDIPPGQYSVTVSGETYTDSSDAPFSIAAATSNALSITTTSLPGGIVGQSYSAQIAAIGGSGDYSWSVSNGSLPPGLTMTSAVCIAAPCQAPATIYGTPTVAGDYVFTIWVTDGIQKTSRLFTLTVGKPSYPLFINPTGAIIQVGTTADFQAFYQPPAECPNPPPGLKLVCNVPAPYPVRAVWTSSNSKIASVTYKEILCPAGSNCLMQQFDYLTSVVTGVSLGTADITATYTDSSGIVFTAVAHVGTVMASGNAPSK